MHEFSLPKTPFEDTWEHLDELVCHRRSIRRSPDKVDCPEPFKCFRTQSPYGGFYACVYQKVNSVFASLCLQNCKGDVVHKIPNLRCEANILKIGFYLTRPDREALLVIFQNGLARSWSLHSDEVFEICPSSEGANLSLLTLSYDLGVLALVCDGKICVTDLFNTEKPVYRQLGRKFSSKICGLSLGYSTGPTESLIFVALENGELQMFLKGKWIPSCRQSLSPLSYLRTSREGQHLVALSQGPTQIEVWQMDGEQLVQKSCMDLPFWSAKVPLVDLAFCTLDLVGLLLDTTLDSRAPSSKLVILNAEGTSCEWDYAQTDLILTAEPDGLRVVSQMSHDLILGIPPCVIQCLGADSRDPSAEFLWAANWFAQGDIQAEENIQRLCTTHSLKAVMLNILRACEHLEVDYSNPFLRATILGKQFLEDAEREEITGVFNTLCGSIRVCHGLNAEAGFFVTLAQLRQTSPEFMVLRRVVYANFPLAYQLARYLNMSRPLLVELGNIWAARKVLQSRALSDDELLAMLTLKYGMITKQASRKHQAILPEHPFIRMNRQYQMYQGVIRQAILEDRLDLVKRLLLEEKSIESRVQLVLDEVNDFDLAFSYLDHPHDFDQNACELIFIGLRKHFRGKEFPEKYKEILSRTNILQPEMRKNFSITNRSTPTIGNLVYPFPTDKIFGVSASPQELSVEQLQQGQWQTVAAERIEIFRNSGHNAKKSKQGALKLIANLFVEECNLVKEQEKIMEKMALQTLEDPRGLRTILSKFTSKSSQPEQPRVTCNLIGLSLFDSLSELLRLGLNQEAEDLATRMKIKERTLSEIRIDTFAKNKMLNELHQLAVATTDDQLLERIIKQAFRYQFMDLVDSCVPRLNSYKSQAFFFEKAKDSARAAQASKAHQQELQVSQPVLETGIGRLRSWWSSVNHQ